MDWQPISKWKTKTGRTFLFYYPAIPSQPYKSIGLGEMYKADSSPLGSRDATHFAVLEPPCE